MAIEWTLSLEKTGGKDNQLKDPVGYRQDITDVVVRSGQKSNMTQFDLFERVSTGWTFWCRVLILESMGIRQVTDEPAAHVPVYLLDDGLQSVHLHDHVHCLVRNHTFQGYLQREPSLRAVRAQGTQSRAAEADIYCVQHGHNRSGSLQVFKYGHHPCVASGLGRTILAKSRYRELSSNPRLITAVWPNTEFNNGNK